MKKNWIYPLVLIVLLLTSLSSCKKDASSSKKDPVITWTNPADINYGISLSSAQLNAKADVDGTFVYTPSSGTMLNIGANQDLKVDFTPSDAVNYNSVSKTVKINVMGIIFNPDLVYGTMTDQDGNEYKTITIGTQTWMAENLRTTKFNDGSDIPLVTDYAAWSSLTTPGYCWLNDDEANKVIYGAFYNFFTVNTGKLAPVGWHVATDAEWTALLYYEGGLDVAGGKLKEIGTTHWLSPNKGATNETGFTALPAGERFENGYLTGLADISCWWSSTVNNSAEAWIFDLGYNYPGANRESASKIQGFSVRCIKD